MSDGESFESQTDTEQSTDNEDVVEQRPISSSQLLRAIMRRTKQTKTVFCERL